MQIQVHSQTQTNKNTKVQKAKAAKNAKVRKKFLLCNVNGLHFRQLCGSNSNTIQSQTQTNKNTNVQKKYKHRKYGKRLCQVT